MDSKISALTELAEQPAATDEFVVVDKSDTSMAASGTDKRITYENLIGTLYPVGSIYISTLSTSPGTLLGVGTWAVFGAGKTLVSLDSGDTDFDTVEETRGAKTVTLTAAESGLPAHDHTITQWVPGSGASGACLSYSSVARDSQNDSFVNAVANSAAAASSAHNNIQPSIVVYMWKRTA